MCLHANMQQLHLHTFIKIYHDSLFTNTLLVIWFTYTHSPILCHSNNFPHTVSPLLCRYLLHYQLVRVHCILLVLLVRNILLLLFNLHTFNTVKFYRMSCTLNNENISTQKYANIQILLLAIQYSYYNILQYYPYYSKPIISIIPISPLYTYINIHPSKCHKLVTYVCCSIWRNHAHRLYQIASQQATAFLPIRTHTMTKLYFSYMCQLPVSNLFECVGYVQCFF